MSEATIVLYNYQEHGHRLVTLEEWERFLAALPDDAREAMRPEESPGTGLTLNAVVSEVQIYMFDYAYRCHRRPALPHEREEWEDGWYLTKKGEAKFYARLGEIATAFERAFGLRPWARGEQGPREGPLDPLSYD